MNGLEAPSRIDRLSHLDSIRGIAALTVVISHLWYLIDDKVRVPYEEAGNALHSISGFCLYIVYKFLTGGRSAVIVFFVLSGFVLSHSLSKKHTPYASYVIRRFFRIYPAFLFAVSASYLLHSQLGQPSDGHALSVWLWENSIPSLTSATWWNHLRLRGLLGDNTLDSASWSLVHEMRISLIFPLLLWLVNRFSWKAVLCAFAFSVASAAVSYFAFDHVATGFTEKTSAQSCLASGHFIFFFVIGAWLSRETARIQTCFHSLSGFSRCALCIVSVQYLTQHGTGNDRLSSLALDYLYGLAAFTLIAFSLEGGWKDFLNQKILIWLGRISYSLYLIHIPILYACSMLFVRSLPIGWVMLMTFIASIAAAEIMVRTIELPSIAFGKRIARKFSERHFALTG